MVGSEQLESAPSPEPLVRAVRATALGRGTQGIPEVRHLVEGALHRAFPYRIWVAGRVDDVRLEPRVGLHFTLQASAADDEPFSLSCLLSEDALDQVAEVLDRVHDADVTDLVAEGRLGRVGGLLRYDVVRATLVLQVSELDPAPAVRGLQEQRSVARAFVRDHGLPERQRSRAHRVAPLAVTVVGAQDDAAVAGACARLRDSPYDVDLRATTVPLHGPGAPAAVAGSVREASLRSDVVLVVRGPGRPLALGVFDAPEVSSAVGEALVPVVCGLGGGPETTACDDASAVSLPDGESAAQWVLDRLGEADQTLHGLAEEVEEQAAAAGSRIRAALDEARGEVLHTADEAQARSAVVRRRVRTRLLVGAAVLAVALVAAAVATRTALLLLGLVVLAGLLLGAWLWSGWAMRRGNRPMSQQDDDFSAVLARLRQVRDELAATSSPEAVHRLRGTAEQLVARGQHILGRELPS